MTQPTDHTFKGLMRNIQERLVAVERRLARTDVGGGGGGDSSGITTIVEGTGIDIVGAGTPASPMVISAEGGGGGVGTIVGGDGIDVEGAGTPTDPMVISLDDDVLLPALPAPVRYADGATHVPAATGWGTMLPGTTPVSITVARPTWVLVTLGAYVVSSAGEVRAGVVLSGATTVSPPTHQQTGLVGQGAAGQTMYLSSGDTGASSTVGQRTIQRTYLLGTGTTTFTIESYISTAGTKNVNYPVLEILPLFYDLAPVPVAPTVGATTRRANNASQSITTADQTLLLQTEQETSGHFSFNASTGVFTCNIAGQYRITYAIGVGTIAAGNIDYVRFSMVQNGTVRQESLMRRDGVGGATDVSTWTATAAVGDTFNFIFTAGQAGGSVAGNTLRTYVELVPVIEGEVGPAFVLPAQAVVGQVNNMKIAQGSFLTGASIAVDGTTNFPIVYPAGFFTTAPQCIFTSNNSRVTVSTGSPTATGCTASVSNWSSGGLPSNQTIYWTAIGV